MSKLQVLVIHGYVQTASTVFNNTKPLRDALSDVADLIYAEGPAVEGNERGSRPWWTLEFIGGGTWKGKETDRWNDTVKWWHDHLSAHSYDGIIGLSQGASMTALLLSMIKNPEKIPGFGPIRHQPLRFAILCSGFISDHPSHFIDLPETLPTLHTVDHQDGVVNERHTVRLYEKFKRAELKEHDEGHSIPIRGQWPSQMRDFIISSTKQ
ncbi:hypothetical protein PROFUN_06150 [Planoprotostelium fungivorum]|uniref:Serine hydrolase domain-containing protein n=1 Tax=Planoprotostelium fungivorum TaxID=1890364 RepID=A0A2P6NPK2_9EUKA|nr:hypothetical protein PROFUN_06150 [Planoprotostelium fungivorum]